MMALRELQAEKVAEAERSFAIVAEMAQMDDLPKDWAARLELCNSVMNRVWGTPKAHTEISGTTTQNVFNHGVIANLLADRPSSDS
jgi:hypothetical protein